MKKYLEEANRTLDEANDSVYRLQRLIEDARWASRPQRKLNRSIRALNQLDELGVLLARSVTALRRTEASEHS